MNKLEKSIRHQLNPFGPSIRAGHWLITSHSVGVIDSRHSYLSSAHADVEDGIVTDIRLYAVGEAKKHRDYYGESLDITEQLTAYIMGRSDNLTWGDLIQSIAQAVTEKEDNYGNY